MAAVAAVVVVVVVVMGGSLSFQPFGATRNKTERKHQQKTANKADVGRFMRSGLRFLAEEPSNKRLAVLSQGSGYANHTLPTPLLSFNLRIRSCWNETSYIFIYIFFGGGVYLFLPLSDSALFV